VKRVRIRDSPIDTIDLFAMTVGHDLTHRGSSHSVNAMALEDRFEVLKEIGDGSFGSVVLARVRSAGASVARRGTVVSGFAICVIRDAWD